MAERREDEVLSSFTSEEVVILQRRSTLFLVKVQKYQHQIHSVQDNISDEVGVLIDFTVVIFQKDEPDAFEELGTGNRIATWLLYVSNPHTMFLILVAMSRTPPPAPPTVWSV